MKFILILLIATPIFALAQEGTFQIVGKFGAPECVSHILLKEYLKTRDGLQKMRQAGGPQKAIERYELALSVLTPRLEEKARFYGMTVTVVFQTVSTIRIPFFEFNGNRHPVAVATSSGDQIKLEFSELGICSFADSNGKINDDEIRNAVNSLVVN